MSTYTDTQQALSVAVAAKAPVILWGAPGQGKSAVLSSMAKQNEMHLETVLASIREPSDFAGLPYVVDGRTTLIAPDWAQRIAEATTAGGSAVLFFDEISTAPPASQAALLRVVLDRVAGDLYLGDEVSIVAAANPPEIAADGWDLSAPTANRFCHLDWALPADVVRDGLTMGWPEVQVPQVDAARLQDAMTEGSTLVAAFLTHRPDMVTVMPDSSAASGRAWPSPRSWEMAARLYGYATAAGITNTARRMLVTGTIGQAAAMEFMSYIAELDLPDPEQVLADPDSLVVPPRGDQVFAIVSSVLAAIKTNMTADRWIAAGGVIATIAKANHADVAVAAGKTWIGMRPDGSIMPNPAHLEALTPILKEAQIL